MHGVGEVSIILIWCLSEVKAMIVHHEKRYTGISIKIKLQ